MLRTFAIATLGLLITTALCRYTVRDVGFVDLGDEGYELYGFVPPDETTELGARFERLTSAIFADANVEAKLADPQRADHPAAHHLAGLTIESFPAAVLVGPGDRAIEVPWPHGDAFDQRAVGWLDAIVDSPARRELTERVVAHFCVAVLARGADAGASDRAASAVQSAFAEIAAVFDRMPKDVGQLPHLIVVPHDQRARERVLLWSLGISTRDDREPGLAIVFGRGRRVGPVLEGEAITGDAALGILSNAGRSCECGLDGSWMRGPRVPLRWEEQTRSRAAELLGFDPDSPMVQAEVNGILARSHGKPGGGAESVEELLLGYSEEIVDTGGSDAPIADRATAPAPVAGTSDTAVWATSALVLAGLCVASAIVGLLLWHRART